MATSQLSNLIILKSMSRKWELGSINQGWIANVKTPQNNIRKAWKELELTENKKKYVFAVFKTTAVLVVLPTVRGNHQGPLMFYFSVLTAEPLPSAALKLSTCGLEQLAWSNCLGFCRRPKNTKNQEYSWRMGIHVVKMVFETKRDDGDRSKMATTVGSSLQSQVAYTSGF